MQNVVLDDYLFSFFIGYNRCSLGCGLSVVKFATSLLNLPTSLVKVTAALDGTEGSHH